MNVQTLKRPRVRLDEEKTFYFDAVRGSDEADGLSPATAKKSLRCLNALVASLTEGVSILVARGSKYFGTLLLGGFCAERDRPLYVGVYGEGEAPVIDGNGADCAVEIKRGNIIFSGFDVTNARGLIGIFVNVTEAGTLSHLIIEHCRVHDVNWNWTQPIPPERAELASLNVEEVCPRARYYYETGGIVFLANATAENRPCRYEDVWIEHNRVERVSRSGIFLTGLWNRRPGTPWGVNAYFSDVNGWYPSRRVEIADNEVHFSGGDGIVLIGSVDSCIEGNVSYHSNYLGRTDTANAGIWPIGCKRVLIQYNEAAYSHLEHGAADGEGFDIDIANEDILFRYNYAHDNDGGAILLCNAGTTQPRFDDKGNPIFGKDGKQKEYEEHGLWRNVTVRDCVCVNNGKAPEHPSFLHFSSTCSHLNVFNNTVIVRSDFKNQLIVRTGDYANCGRQKYLFFADNLFCAAQPLAASFAMEYADEWVFEGNMYYNVGEDCAKSARDRSAIYAEKAPLCFPAGNSDGFEKALSVVKGTEESVKGKFGAKIEF